MALLPCVEVPSKHARAAGSVIWMHGLGASGHDFEPLVPMLGMDHVRFVFPHAPAQPVTINGGMVMPSWYDILSMERTRLREDEGQIRESATLIQALIEHEKERGVPANKIVLAGFSQGGAMALHVGTRYSEALAGIMVLSAYQLIPTTYAAERAEANLATPMLFCHGTQDPMVPIEGGRDAHAAMENNRRECLWREYPMQHEVCAPEVGDISRWLRARILAPSSPEASSVDKT